MSIVDRDNMELLDNAFVKPKLLCLELTKYLATLVAAEQIK